MQQTQPPCVKGVGSSPQCPFCNGLSIKYGFDKRKKQRYRCKFCYKTFLICYTRQAYHSTINNSIINHLKQSCGISNISRLVQISKQTVLSRIRQIAGKLRKPPVVFGMTYEVDEQHTYIQNRAMGEIWITYALCRETKLVVDFVIGNRTNADMRKLTETLVLSNPVKIYTDRLSNYKSLIPVCIHSTKRRGTNHIERQNLQNRTDLKRLGRSTLCYSKSASMLAACLKIYFWG